MFFGRRHGASRETVADTREVDRMRVPEFVCLFVCFFFFFFEFCLRTRGGKCGKSWDPKLVVHNFGFFFIFRGESCGVRGVILNLRGRAVVGLHSCHMYGNPLL